jgi:hypothetical protein
MWTELAKFNPSNDPVFSSSLRDSFIKEQFDLKKNQSGTSLLDYTATRHSLKAHGFPCERRMLHRSYLQLYLKIHCGNKQSTLQFAKVKTWKSQPICFSRTNQLLN